jgi:WD40 repeat protein
MTSDAVGRNQRTLQQLAQAMALSRGQFKLILVRCNYGEVCESWSRELTQTCQDQHQFELSQVHLPRQSKNLIDILNSIRQLPPEGVQILGLNQLADVRQFLANTNQTRDRLRRNCPFPIAIWLDDNSLRQMLNVANDLYSWTTSKRFYPTLDDLQQGLHHLLEEFFQRLPQASPEQWLGSRPLLSRSEQRELDLAQNELNGNLSPSIQADLAIIQSHQHLLQQEISQAQQQLQQGANIWKNSVPPTPSIQKRLGWVAFQQAILHLWDSEQQQTLLSYTGLQEIQRQFQDSQQRFQASDEAELAQIVANAAVVRLVAALTPVINAHPSSDPEHLSGIIVALADVNEQLCEQESFPFPRLWLNALDHLHQLYFYETQDYRRAFSIQQQQGQVQRYGGQRAFVGATRLQGILYQRCSLDNLPPEIRESGREDDVRQLRERLCGTESKILVIHGQSGVGKSSLINAGLLPLLRQATLEGGREGVPILLRVYDQWEEQLARTIDREIQRYYLGVDVTAEESPRRRIESQLVALEQQHKQTILVFDQFEEFFFANSSQQNHKAFFEFIGHLCSNVQQLGALKVVLSLRTDYVGHLLLCNDLESMNCIGRDILSRQVLHKLGNLSPEQTSQVLATLAPHLQEELRTRLVADLSQETETVRPIELQIIGYELESQGIQDLPAYKMLGNRPKEQLVQGYLDDIVQACGPEHESLANVALYLLTDERRTRPLRTYEELLDELQPVFQSLLPQQVIASLDLVLEIFTTSGLVVVIPGEPNRYQLVHDYLAEFIYQSRQSDLIASLKEEQGRRLAAEQELEDLLTETNLARAELTQVRRVTGIEKECRIALRNFTICRELEALLMAAKLGFKIQESIKRDGKGSQTLQPIYCLHEILKDIRIKNYLDYHNDRINTTHFNPDGTKIVSASRDTTVKLWSTDTGQEIFSLENHSREVNTAYFSPDGTQIVSASEDTTIKIWDASTGQEILSLENHRDDVYTADFVAGGTQVLSASADKTIKIWDVRTGEELQSLDSRPEGKISALQMSSDNQYIVGGYDTGEIGVWRLKDNSNYMFCYDFRVESEKVVSMKFLSETNRVIVAFENGYITTVFLYESLEKYSRRQENSCPAMKWVDIRIPKTNRRVKSVDFSLDLSRAVTCSKNGDITILNLTTRQELDSFKGHSYTVNTVNLSRDQTTLVSGSHDKRVIVWDLQPRNPVNCLYFHSARVNTTKFSPDGSMIVSGSHDKTIKIWDVLGQEVRVTLTGHEQAVRSTSFSPDSQRVASGCWDGTVKLWDIASGEVLASMQHSRHPRIPGVYSVKFSPDGNHLVSASADGTIKIWETQTGEQTHYFDAHSAPIRSVNFSPDGNCLISGDQAGFFRILDIRSRREIYSAEGHPNVIKSINFSPDGKRLVSSSWDGTFKIWDAQTYQLINCVQAHTYGINNANFSDDGSLIISVSLDGIRLWDTEMGEELYYFHTNSEVHNANFSPDGRTIVAALDDGAIATWRIESLDELLNRACDWLRPYLTSNPYVTESDRALCNIPPRETSPTD